MPSATRLRYSFAWPSTKIRPITKVRVNQRRSACTSPRSAAKTPIWHVTEDSTRTMVKVSAYQMLRCWVCSFHSSGAAARMEKYIAKSAAKNISSLESHTIVPTLTMLGLVSEWIWLLGMAEAAVTGALLPLTCVCDRRGRAVAVIGAVTPDLPHRHNLGAVLHAVQPPLTTLATGTPAPFTPERLVTGVRLDSWLAVGLVLAAGVYLYGVHRLRTRGDRWPLARTLLFLLPGLGSIAAVTMTGIEAYDTTLLSVHMVQHMVLSMIAPIFLA